MIMYTTYTNFLKSCAKLAKRQTHTAYAGRRGRFPAIPLDLCHPSLLSRGVRRKAEHSHAVSTVVGALRNTTACHASFVGEKLT